MKLEATLDRVIVEPRVVEKKSEGGVILPDTLEENEKPKEGSVLHAGPTVKGLKIGDYVFFSEYSGRKLMLEGKKVLVLREDDVVAKISGGANE